MVAPIERGVTAIEGKPQNLWVTTSIFRCLKKQKEGRVQMAKLSESDTKTIVIGLTAVVAGLAIIGIMVYDLTRRLKFNCPI